MQHPRSSVLAGRTVLVTGATSGIGRATAVGPASRRTRTWALHPGMVSTSFGAEDPGRIQRLLVPLIRPFMRSPARGAATSIHLASDPDLALVSGGYFAGSRPRRSSVRSADEAVAARLWAVSAELVGLAAAARG
jgi:hypothetical protein